MPGPIPPYQNLPIDISNYAPRRFFIADIQLGKQTLVTTTQNHDYVIGQNVRLLIPQFNGSRQLSKQTALVIEIPQADQVLLDLDSSLYVSPFVTSTNRNQPQIMAVGDINLGQNNETNKNTKTFVLGSFRNIG